jgi:RNA polymerase sigma factor (sigma-70 family)
MQRCVSIFIFKKIETFRPVGLPDYRTERIRRHLGQEEADLITRCRKGDIKSYELLYNRYSRAMYHTCLRIVMNTADAEDILQEAFMEAFISLDKLKNAAAFGGWIKRIMINKSVNFIRRHRKNWLEIEDAELTNIPEEQALDESEFRGKVDSIMEAMGTLPEKYRMVINLHIFEQMSFEEIASVMDLPSSTARVQYLRGKQKILDRLSK